MALNAAVEFDVRTTGSDTNGGGFRRGSSGTDWSQQDSPQYSVTDGVTAGTTTITSATASFGTDVVGNLVYVQGGTGNVTAGWYEITSRTNATTIVVDRSTGLTAGTGVTLKIGGALASPGKAASIATVSGHIIHLKSGTYTVTTTSNNTSNGVATISAGVRLTGYSVIHNDYGTRPVIQLQASLTASAITTVSGSAGSLLINVEIDCNTGNTASTGFSASSGAAIIAFCKVTNAKVIGISAVTVLYCEVANCSGTAGISAGIYVKGCISHDNTCTGILLGTNGIAVNCVSYNNSGASSDGFTYSSTSFSADSCVAYNNGRDGFRSGALTLRLVNCISYGHAAGYGFNSTISNGWVLLDCAAGSNASGIYPANATAYETGTVTLTADPFTNAAGGDFTLNNTAGGGAACRAAGYGTMPASAGVGYPDIGAIQHQDSASGGGLLTHPGMAGGMRG